MKKNKFLLVILIAVFCKVLLFSILVINSPQGRFQNDSFDYLETAKVLFLNGIFARVNNNGLLELESYRTPGYPAYLVLIHHLLKISISGVILTQILVSIIVALVTHKTANRIDRRLAFLSLLFVLFDPPITIYSLMILSETVYLLFMCFFMYTFIRYLEDRKIKFIIYSASVLAIATYVRPITYYFGIIVAIFMLCVNIHFNIKRAITHVLIFLIVVYGIIGIWQFRNYNKLKENYFSNRVKGGYINMGLYKSYSKNKVDFEKDISPFKYYIHTSMRAFLSLMTRPGPFKYFKSKITSTIGNIFSYPWMVFWLIGFIVGVYKINWNIYYQFCLLVIIYFIVVSIIGVSTLVSERFMVPMVPFLAIISAFGWINILDRLKTK